MGLESKKQPSTTHSVSVRKVFRVSLKRGNETSDWRNNGTRLVTVRGAITLEMCKWNAFNVVQLLTMVIKQVSCPTEHE